MNKSTSFNIVLMASLLLVTGNLLTAQSSCPSGFDLESIYMMNEMETYSVCPENPTGA